MAKKNSTRPSHPMHLSEDNKASARAFAPGNNGFPRVYSL